MTYNSYTKTCQTCKLNLSYDKFTKCARSKDGLYYECKFCKSYRVNSGTPNQKRQGAYNA